jgi:hypothetical protein
LETLLAEMAGVLIAGSSIIRPIEPGATRPE